MNTKTWGTGAWLIAAGALGGVLGGAVGGIVGSALGAAASPALQPTPAAAIPVAAQASAKDKAMQITALTTALDPAAGASAAQIQQARNQIDALLQYGAPQTVQELAYTPMSDRGRALALWAKASFEAGREDMLAAVFVQLALGENLQTRTVDYLEHSLPRPGDAERQIYPNARALGYYAAALRAGFEAAHPKAASRGNYGSGASQRIQTFLKSAAKRADFFGLSQHRNLSEQERQKLDPAGQWVATHLQPLLEEKKYGVDVWLKAAVGPYKGPARTDLDQGALNARFALDDAQWLD